MQEIKICFEFKGGKGYAYVNLVPTNYGIYKQDFSGCHNFSLAEGDYTVIIDGVSPAGGTTITITGDNLSIQRKINAAGHFSKVIPFTIKKSEL